MPYIQQHLHADLQDQARSPQNPGELNYLLTYHILQYLDSQGLQYKTLNDIVGALECAKQEFIRRVVNPYEDKKKNVNGDVYA